MYSQNTKKIGTVQPTLSKVGLQNQQRQRIAFQEGIVQTAHARDPSVSGGVDTAAQSNAHKRAGELGDQYVDFTLARFAQSQAPKPPPPPPPSSGYWLRGLTGYGGGVWPFYN
jgi:hypothetical protein